MNKCGQDRTEGNLRACGEWTGQRGSWGGGEAWDGQESGGIGLGQRSGDGEEGEDGKRLVLHGAVRTLGEVAVVGDEDDGEEGFHDAVAVVVVECRVVAGRGRPNSERAQTRTASSTSPLGHIHCQLCSSDCYTRALSRAIERYISNRTSMDQDSTQGG